MAGSKDPFAPIRASGESTITPVSRPHINVDEVSMDPLEAVEQLRDKVPGGLGRRPKREGRKTPMRPAERNRRARMMTCTFSTEVIPADLRRLAARWGLYAPDRRSPAHSAVVEYLLVNGYSIQDALDGKVPQPAGNVVDSWS